MHMVIGVTPRGLPAQMTLMYSNPALCAVFAWIVGTEAVTCICVAGVTASVVGRGAHRTAALPVWGGCLGPHAHAGCGAP